MSSWPPAPTSAAPTNLVASPPAVVQLIKQNPPGAGSCAGEAAVLAAATANLLRSLGQVALGAPTVVAEVPAILGFIAAAMQTGAAAANYANCRERTGPEAPK